MTIWVVSINNSIQIEGFVSLEELCKHYKLSDNLIRAGKTMFIKDNNFYHVNRVNVNRIKGRGRKSFNTNPKE